LKIAFVVAWFVVWSEISWINGSDSQGKTGMIKELLIILSNKEIYLSESEKSFLLSTILIAENNFG